MIRTSAFLLLATTLASNNFKENEKLASVESEFPLIWKSEMGNVCFRSNLIVNPDNLIIGSNGEQFIDYNLYDNKSGVYVINRKTGKTQNHFGAECLGDMDVTGLLSYNNKLYFGNDNDEFFCTTMQGKTIWRNETSGDIEHEPVLIQNHHQKEIVYASESGEVRAVNPETGKSIWVYYTPDFNSWKPGDNRVVFKVKSYFSNTSSFFTKPLLFDLNKDDVTDLVYLTYDKMVYAINGQNGNLLWRYQSDKKRIKNIIPTIQNNGEVNFLLLTSFYKSSDLNNSLVIRINEKGKEMFETPSQGNFFETSLNSITAKEYGTVCADRESVLLFDKKGKETKIDCRFEGVRKKYYDADSEIVSRKFYDPLISKEMFTYQGNKDCILLLSQCDIVNQGPAFIEIFSLDKKKVIKRLELPESSEMAPIVMDVNKDGYLDLLVNCFDGYMYCYNLKIKA